MFNLVLDGLKDPMKETKAWEIKFKQPQNGVKLTPETNIPKK
jgi:hypothetical protein